MFDDLIPPSPTSLDESTQQRSLRISSSRRKILRKHQQKQVKSSFTHVTDSFHSQFDPQNSLNDDIDVIPGSQVPIRSYTPHPDTDTPIAKRAKLASDPEQNPRKLNYDSDELTQRHSPFSSTAGSPVFFDLDDDPEPVESQKSTTADSYATARDPSFVFGGEIPPGAFLGFRTAANKPIHLPPQQNHLDIFKESPEEEAMDEFDPFPVDSQLSDHVLDKVANRKYQSRLSSSPYLTYHRLSISSRVHSGAATSNSPFTPTTCKSTPSPIHGLHLSRWQKTLRTNGRGPATGQAVGEGIRSGLCKGRKVIHRGGPE